MRSESAEPATRVRPRARLVHRRSPDLGFTTFTCQREPAVGGLLDQTVDQQRVQRAVALRGVRQPRHVQLRPRDRRRRWRATHPAAGRAPGDRCPRTSATRRAGSVDGGKPADRHAQTLNGHSPQRGDAGRAHRRAELHQGDRKARCVSVIGQRARRRRRDRGRCAGESGPAVHGPGHDAAHVGVDDGHPLAVGEARDRPRGVRADAGQRRAACRRRRAPRRRARPRSPSRTRAAAWPGADSRACPRPAARRRRWRRRSPTASATAPPSRARSARRGRRASAAA